MSRIDKLASYGFMVVYSKRGMIVCHLRLGPTVEKVKQ